MHKKHLLKLICENFFLNISSNSGNEEKYICEWKKNKQLRENKYDEINIVFCRHRISQAPGDFPNINVDSQLRSNYRCLLAIKLSARCRIRP